MITGLWPGVTCSIISQIPVIQWQAIAVELIDLGNSGNKANMSDICSDMNLDYLKKNAEKIIEWLCLLLILEVPLTTQWLHS